MGWAQPAEPGSGASLTKVGGVSTLAPLLMFRETVPCTRRQTKAQTKDGTDLQKLNSKHRALGTEEFALTPACVRE